MAANGNLGRFVRESVLAAFTGALVFLMMAYAVSLKREIHVLMSWPTRAGISVDNGVLSIRKLRPSDHPQEVLASGVVLGAWTATPTAGGGWTTFDLEWGLPKDHYASFILRVSLGPVGVLLVLAVGCGFFYPAIKRWRRQRLGLCADCGVGPGETRTRGACAQCREGASIGMGGRKQMFGEGGGI